MKISSVTTYLINPKTASGLTVTKNLLFTKIMTDEGGGVLHCLDSFFAKNHLVLTS